MLFNKQIYFNINAEPLSLNCVGAFKYNYYKTPFLNQSESYEIPYNFI